MSWNIDENYKIEMTKGDTLSLIHIFRLEKDVAKGKERKAIAETIKKAEESVEAMKVARKSMLKYNSSFAEGLQVRQ